MMRHLRPVAFVLGVGFVLFAFSERLFWSFWRADDSLGAAVGGWLIYALMGYVALGVSRLLRVGGLSGWVMLGALFGWIDEGVYAMTLYGDPSMPFPATLAWTGLAWHALLSVGVGLVMLRRCLAAPSLWPTLGLGVLIAAFWATWASGWTAETPPLSASPTAFFAHAALLTLGLAVAETAISAGEVRDAPPSRLWLGLASALVVLFFAGVTVPAIPWSPAILLPLLALVTWTMWRRRGAAAPATTVDVIGQPIRFRNLVGLAVIPPVATTIYAGLLPVGLELSIHLTVALVTSFAGVLVFVVALVRSSGTVRAIGWSAAPQHR